MRRSRRTGDSRRTRRPRIHPGDADFSAQPLSGRARSGPRAYVRRRVGPPPGHPEPSIRWIPVVPKTPVSEIDPGYPPQPTTSRSGDRLATRLEINVSARPPCGEFRDIENFNHQVKSIIDTHGPVPTRRRRPRLPAHPALPLRAPPGSPCQPQRLRHSGSIRKPVMMGRSHLAGVTSRHPQIRRSVAESTRPPKY